MNIRYLNHKDKKGNAILSVMLVTAVFALLALSTYTVWLVTGLMDAQTIYQGVYVNERNVSGLTREQLIDQLHASEQAPLDERVIRVFYEQDVYERHYPDMGFTVNIEKVAEEAWNVGRVGNPVRRVIDIISTYVSPVRLYTRVDYDARTVEQFISEIEQAVYRKRVDDRYVIEQDQVRLIAGSEGIRLDRRTLAESLYDALDRYESLDVNAPVSIFKREPIDANSLFYKVRKEAEDAYMVVEDQKVTIIREQLGRTINRELLLESADRLQNETGSVIVLSIQTVVPDAMKEDLQAMLFKDELSVQTTEYQTYDENTENRGINIRLTAQRVHGTILAPGDVFSFNDIVGPRTPQQGFMPANVYVAGEIETGYGGGICQISSLLYLNALYAGLEIVERVNHQFTVSYTDPGLDATVAFGYIDFRFRNNTDWPIKIVCESVDRMVTCRIIGTDQNPGRRIEVNTRILQTYPFEEVLEPTDELAPGVRKWKQDGFTGYYVHTTRTFITEQDRIVQDLGNSFYHKRDRIILIGVDEELLEEENEELLDQWLQTVDEPQSEDEPDDTQEQTNDEP